MATRIRLQRHGKKSKAFFHLVVADSRAKRDGKFIEKLGTYNPNTNPATIDIKFDRALTWLRTGAEMSETARAILSYKGVLYKNHLLNGVTKGALTEADVEKKFEAWLQEKDSKITSKIDGLSKGEAQAKAAALKAEEASKEAKAKAIEAKNTPEVEAAPEVENSEEIATEDVAVESAPEAEVAEEASVVAEEETPETPETPEVEETPDEVPAIEAETEETPEAKEEGTAEA